MPMSSSSSSRRTRKDLPFDVVDEILLRLPAKHVLRCKLLSKPYYELIKTPAFTKKHSLFHHQFDAGNRNIVCLMRETETFNLSGMRVTETFNLRGTVSDIGRTLLLLLPSPSQVYVPDPVKSADRFFLVGSSNGLLCVLVNRSFFLLWNPLTREHKMIHSPPKVPYHINDAMGFGYDAITDDYKVVKIWRRSRLEFWSMKTNTWREVDIQEHTSSSMKTNTGLLVRGRLYWLSYVSCTRRHNHWYPVLESFDLVKDSFCTQIILPDVSNGTVTTLIDFMGSLAFSIYLDDYLHTPMYEIWVMDHDDEDNKNLWRKQFSVGPMWGMLHFTRMSVDGKLLMTRDQNYLCRHFLYDPHNKELKEISVDHCQPREVTAVNPDWSFVESLAGFT